MRGEPAHLREVGHRQNAGDDRHVNAGGARPIEKAEVAIDVEEELGDRPAGAGVDLALEVVDVGLRARRLRMRLRIGGDGNVEAGHPLQPGDQIGGIGVAVRMRLVPTRPLRRIAAQGDDVANAGRPVPPRHLVDLLAAGADAGQVRRRLQRRFPTDANDRRVGAFAGRSTGAVGHRDVCRLQRRETLDAGPECLFHLRRLRRKEFERNLHVSRQRRRHRKVQGVSAGSIHILDRLARGTCEAAGQLPPSRA